MPYTPLSLAADKGQILAHMFSGGFPKGLIGINAPKDNERGNFKRNGKASNSPDKRFPAQFAAKNSLPQLPTAGN